MKSRQEAAELPEVGEGWRNCSMAVEIHCAITVWP
jgi:hypothetical protein